MTNAAKDSVPACEWRDGDGWCRRPVERPGHVPAEPCCPLGAGHGELPRWDDNMRTLFVGATRVKKFKQPARDQEAVLRAFEEAHWERKIDDPLPWNAKVDAKKRVHFTIRHLNYQEGARMKFYGDGTGQAFCWAPRCAAFPPEDGAPPPH